MRVDYKISIWRSFEVPEDKEEIFIKAMKEGKIENFWDAEELMNYEIRNDEFLYETEEVLGLEDNNFNATLEIWDDTDINSSSPIYTNKDNKYNESQIT